MELIHQKSLKKLWIENDRRSGFFVWSPTNRTKKYKLLTVLRTKNYAIVRYRGKGMKWFRKYYTIFVLDNPRWTRV